MASVQRTIDEIERLLDYVVTSRADIEVLLEEVDQDDLSISVRALCDAYDEGEDTTQFVVALVALVLGLPERTVEEPALSEATVEQLRAELARREAQP